MCVYIPIQRETVLKTSREYGCGSSQMKHQHWGIDRKITNLRLTWTTQREMFKKKKLQIAGSESRLLNLT